MRWLLALAGVVALAACSSGNNLPGKATVGTYKFTATQTRGDCSFIEQPDGGFSYNGTLTYDPGTDHGYLTVNDVSRDGGFDGGVLDATASANRVFQECNCGNGVVVTERIVFALVSDSQRKALGGNCPPDPLDGGIPSPDPDAGIVAPGPRGEEYDAPLACGVQTDQIVPGAGCQCPACTLEYSISGVRQ